MRSLHTLSITSLAVAVMLLLSVSVHPAMAAEAVNEQLGACPGCSTGPDDLSSIPGLGNKKVPTVNIREITSETALTASASRLTGGSATVSGTERLHPNSAITLNIRDPFRKASDPGTVQAGAARSITDDEVAAIIANMSRDGYDLTTESTHRYESTVTSDDLLTLNISQEADLEHQGFTRTAKDSVLSYRDATFYTFTNRTTDSRVYLVAVQRLDASGNPAGTRELAISPEFSASGARLMADSYGTTLASGSSCAMEWIAVVLAAFGLIINIVLILIGTNAVYAPILMDAIAMIISHLMFGSIWVGDDGRAVADRFWAARPYLIGVAIITGILLLLVLMYAVYKLGICMGWWTSGDEVLWSYQYGFNETTNGKTVTVALHDRFALSLFTDTRVDKDASWMVESHPGLIIKDELKATSDNGTIQSWLVEATEPGPMELSLKYMSSQPVPPTVAGTPFTLRVSVGRGNWEIMSVDETGDGTGAGAFPSLIIRHSGVPSLSYYNEKQGKIVYGTRPADSWILEPVAESAGTRTVSLALDPSGRPAISFGDGLHYGNLMYAEKNGTQWDILTADSGSLGDAGQYSSLVFDRSGNPHIAYNDGHTFAALKYASWNGSAWEIVKADTGGVTGDTGYGPSLAFDPAGHPHIAYTSGKYFADLMYATDPGSGFTASRVDDGGGRTKSTGFDPSLALDSRGFAHISYYDASEKDLRYASWNGTGWELETVDSINDVGAHPSLALDAGNHPHISYYDASNRELRYATYDTVFGRWVIRTIDNDGDVGQYSSIALDPSGHPCFAYYDAGNHALKYAGWKG